MALAEEARAAPVEDRRADALRCGTVLSGRLGPVVLEWARRRAAPLWCTLGVVAIGMAVSLLWLPLVGHATGWLTPGDIWGTFRDAHLVGWGGEADVYQAGTGFLSPPAFPVLLAPVAMVSSALGLSASFPLYLQHPTSWLLLGPAELLCGAVVLFPVDALARRLGAPRARRIAVVCACAGLSIPLLLIWGHPEDLLAVACALWALPAAFDRRWTKAAGLVGLGLAFQPLVVLVVPLVLARTPRRLWARAGAMVVAPGALLLAFPILHTWRTTLHAVVDQPTFPTIGHATPWLALAPVLHAHGPAAPPWAGRLFATSTETTAGGPERLLAIAVALLVGVLAARTRPSEPTTVWLAAVCLSLRCVFESVMFPYYVVPALLLAVLCASCVPRWRSEFLFGVSAACSWAAYLHASPWTYDLAVTGLLLLACVLAVPARRGAAVQRAGDPAGGGAPLGSKGSRVAPQLGSVRGAGGLAAAGEAALDVGASEVAACDAGAFDAGACDPGAPEVRRVDAEVEAAACTLDGVVAGAAEP